MDQVLDCHKPWNIARILCFIVIENFLGIPVLFPRKKMLTTQALQKESFATYLAK